ALSAPLKSIKPRHQFINKSVIVDMGTTLLFIASY
ncbi:MAG: hypothetical protein ACI82S_002851, partial [Patiriisocius sp.]